jgi:hypothetical protein
MVQIRSNSGGMLLSATHICFYLLLPVTFIEFLDIRMKISYFVDNISVDFLQTVCYNIVCKIKKCCR